MGLILVLYHENILHHLYLYCCTVWTEAMSNEDDAVDNIESEYWDVDEIIGIREER